jgi:hypothetical protein
VQPAKSQVTYQKLLSERMPIPFDTGQLLSERVQRASNPEKPLSERMLQALDPDLLLSERMLLGPQNLKTTVGTHADSLSALQPLSERMLLGPKTGGRIG